MAVDGADADLGVARHVVHLRLASLLREDRSRGGQDALAITPRVGAKRADGGS